MLRWYRAARFSGRALEWRMCADYTPSRKELIVQRFKANGLDFDYPREAFPGYMAPILRARHDAPGEVEAAPAMFGMVPHWADLKLARQTYNARTETVASKPSFRNAWKRRQFCLIPAENIFEPSYETCKPVRWRIEDVDGGPLCVAGIWESRADPREGGGMLLSYSMLTIAAADHPVMRRFHQPGDENKRMVVMLRPEQFAPWLQAELDDPTEFFQQYPADRLVAQADPIVRAPRSPKGPTAQADLLA